MYIELVDIIYSDSQYCAGYVFGSNFQATFKHNALDINDYCTGRRYVYHSLSFSLGRKQNKGIQHESMYSGSPSTMEHQKATFKQNADNPNQTILI